MYTYVRMTKLSDIRGRSAYITNKTGRHKEEDILCCGGATENWLAYAKYEQEHQKSAEANNEGRELIIALPNSWGNPIGKVLLQNRVDALAQKLLGKDTDYQFAVHWNSTHTNLHAHIIFSERKKCPQTNEKGAESDFWDRDIYLTSQGTIARRKADRALNEDGTVKPPIHRKGDPKNVQFTAKDTRYKSKAWLEDVKEIVTANFRLSHDKKHITNYLHTYHVGKNPKSAEKTRKINDNIRNINKLLNDLQNEGYKLKPQGDKAYYELWGRICGDVEDGVGADEWIYKHIITNGDKIERKQAKQAEKHDKIIVKAYEYLDEIINNDIYCRLPSRIDYDHGLEIKQQLAISYPADSKKIKKYEKYVSKALSSAERKAYAERKIKEKINKIPDNTIYQPQISDTLNSYIKSYDLDIEPVPQLNKTEMANQIAYNKEMQRRRAIQEQNRREMQEILRKKHEQEKAQSAAEPTRSVRKKDDWSR